MEHVVRPVIGYGFACGACAFAALADDLKSVAQHVVEHQPFVDSPNAIFDYGFFGPEDWGDYEF